MDEQLKKLRDLAEDAIAVFEAEEHIRYSTGDKLWYCRSHCEVEQCPVLKLKEFLEGTQ